ncbi:MAG TPA: hypothetical protein ENJ90_10895 [Devosia sp.]|nr:hypothetical protein [Devosia sp.]
MKMTRKISQMRNLGPAMERMLAEIDIRNEDDLREKGAIDAWHQLRFVFGKRISLVALYAMHASLEDRLWQDVSKQEKARLKRAATESKTSRNNAKAAPATQHGQD